MPQQAKPKGMVNFGRWATPKDDGAREAHGLPGIEPTKERARHGKIVKAASISTEKEAAQPGVRMHRTQPPIERYAKRGQITERQAMAAGDLRSDYEFGMVGIRSGAEGGRGGRLTSICDAQLDAATAYKQAVQAMGKHVSAVVQPIVIGDAAGGEITAGEVAGRFETTTERIMGILSVGLDMLADHYKSRESRQRAARYS